MKKQKHNFVRRPLQRKPTLKEMANSAIIALFILWIITAMTWIHFNIKIELEEIKEKQATYQLIEQVEAEYIEYEEEVKTLDEILENNKTVYHAEARAEAKPLDLDKLAYAVSMAETSWFTKWYWVTHNNGQWIKHWNTVPCPWVPKLKMCKFNSQEESNEAFKKIWGTHYKRFPDIRLAEIWTGKDRAETWLNAVKQYYYN